MDVQDWRATLLNVPWRNDFAQTKTDDEISLDVTARGGCGVTDIDTTAPESPL